jgi:hypothetical protein
MSQGQLLTLSSVKGQYDFATIHTLLNTCPVLHVSFVDPEHPFPVVLYVLPSPSLPFHLSSPISPH